MAKKRVSRRPGRQAKKKRQSKGNKFNLVMKRLKGMKLGQQRQALQMSNDVFIRQMCAQVKKLRHASLPGTLKKRMQRQKKNLRKFVLPRTSVRVKRKMLTQRGGLLPLLVAALPAVGAMVGNIIAGTRRRSD